MTEDKDFFGDVKIRTVEEADVAYERTEAYLGCRTSWYYYRARHRTPKRQEYMIDREYLGFASDETKEEVEEATDEIVERARREVSLLRSLASEGADSVSFVRRCIDAFRTNDWIYRVYPVLPEGTCDAHEFYEYYHKRGLTPLVIRSIVHQLLRALRHVHSKRIVHCRVQPRSLLLIPDANANDCGYRLQLTNFEAARRFYEANPYPTKHRHFSEMSTLWYDAPELLLSEPGASRDALCGPETDVWAVGVTFAELCMRRPLFPGACEIDALFKIYRQRGTPTVEDWPEVTELPHYNSDKFPKWTAIEFPDEVRKCLNEQGRHLMTQMLSLDPNKRPTARDGSKHMYFPRLLRSEGGDD